MTAVVNLTSLASSDKLFLTSKGMLTISVTGYYSWGFDIDFFSTTANGVLSYFNQYSLQFEEGSLAPTAYWDIKDGKYGNSYTKIVIDNMNTTTKNYLVLLWDGYDSASGYLQISGTAVWR